MSSGAAFISTGPGPWTCTRICSTTSGFASVVMSPVAIRLEIARQHPSRDLSGTVLGMSGYHVDGIRRAILPMIVSIASTTFFSTSASRGLSGLDGHIHFRHAPFELVRHGHDGGFRDLGTVRHADSISLVA